MKRLINILLYIWQLPQNLLGLIVYFFVRKHIDSITNVCGRCLLIRLNIRFGVSLGYYVFYSELFDKQCKMHEYGHHIQSEMLGWLYLLIVGIKSGLNNLIHRIYVFDYYEVFPEKWADKLGGVTR